MIFLLLPVGALAGELDGLVALDGLTATSTNDGANVGPEEKLSHQDLGIRVRFRLQELDGRAQLHFDYRGREALGGLFPNRTLRLLYRAEARYELVEDTLSVGVGRFHAPIPTFTIVDGANVRWQSQSAYVGAFGGRRGISGSRENIGGLLPVVGLHGGVTSDTTSFDASLAYSEDRIIVGGTGARDDAGGLSALARVTTRPSDLVRLGALTTLTQGVTYAIGPTWGEGIAEATAIGLFQASGWASLTPVDALRWDLDLTHQNMQTWGVGLVGEDTTVVRPTFTDVRTKVRVGPRKIGWIEPLVRYRIRPSWQELRVAARLHVHDLGIPGPYLRARASFDDIRADGAGQDVGPRDRTFGAASIGFRHEGFDGNVGASYVQRAAKPVGSRSTTSPDSDDLSPFVLEADPIASARVFYSGKRWFSGLDVEKHLTQPEVRAMIQVGVLTEVGW